MTSQAGPPVTQTAPIEIIASTSPALPLPVNAPGTRPIARHRTGGIDGS